MKATKQQRMFSIAANQASRELGELNELFLSLVDSGLTKEELQANIDRRPALWRRWQHWLTDLPSTTAGNTKTTQTNLNNLTSEI